MSFHAKPSGGYSISSVEGTDNIIAAYNYLEPLGYTKEAVSGLLGNVVKESSLNPWLWERSSGGVPDQSSGYGFVQFTPGSEYINRCTGITGYAPSLITNAVDPDASPDDGYAQLYVVDSDYLAKWVGSCWRSYWDSSINPNTYTLTQNMLLEYGGSISMAEFRSMNVLTYATMAFLGCYEGPHDYDPNHPTWYQKIDDNFADRYSYAQQIYNILQPYTPGSDIFVELKILDVNYKRKFNNI